MADAQPVLDLNHGARRLAARPGLTVFAACRSQKTFLPTACGGRGACGMCRVKVTAGELSPPTDIERQRPADEELAGGWRLACQAKLTGGDVAIEVGEDAIAAREMPAVVESVEDIARNVRRLRLRLKNGERTNHRAGQFVAFAPKGVGAPTAVRAYSLANPPCAGDVAEFVIRRAPQGLMTTWIFGKIAPGDDVVLTGPFGDFYLRPSSRPAVMVAGGSGLSPFFSMIRELERSAWPDREIRLFFGAVDPEDLYGLEELCAVAARHPNFSFTPSLSGNCDHEKCALGLVTDVMAARVKDGPACDAYLCGSPGMVGAARGVLEKLGVPPDRVFFDRFG